MIQVSKWTCAFDGLIPLEGKASGVCLEPPASQTSRSLASSSSSSSCAFCHLLFLSLSCFAWVLQTPSQMTMNRWNIHEKHRHTAEQVVYFSVPEWGYHQPLNLHHCLLKKNICPNFLCLSSYMSNNLHPRHLASYPIKFK